jgi:hypothetical protein
MSRRNFAPIFLVPLALITLLAPQAIAQFGPAPFYTTVVPGDYIHVGNSTRTVANGGTQPAVGPVGVPAFWPGGVVAAYANWTFLSDTPAAGSLAEASILVNGIPVVGALTGTTPSDTCWGKAGVRSYTADITAIVAGFGPSVFAFDGVKDKPDGVTGAISFGEGVSMQVVYADGGPLRNVNLYDGAINSDMVIPTTGIGAMAWAPPLGPGPTHFSLNGLDGQLPLPGFGDDFFINGVLATGMPGTDGPGNAWIGMVGPAAPGPTVQYDIINADIFGLFGVGPGDGGLTFETIGAPGTWDCIAHTFGGFSYPVIPEPTALAAVSLAGLMAMRRRRV